MEIFWRWEKTKSEFHSAPCLNKAGLVEMPKAFNVTSL